MYNWLFDSTSPLPIYKQLADYFFSLIENGTLIHDQQLLSQRDYCKIFNVSRPTINKTFEILEQKKLIILEPKKKARVCLKPNMSNPSVDWEEYIKRSRYIEQFPIYRNLTQKRGSYDIINLHECCFGKEFYPFRPIKKAMELLVNDLPQHYHHSNLDIRGILPLRQAICNYLMKEGIHVEPSQILVCNSLRNAFIIIFEAIGGYHTTCYLEEESMFMTDKNIMGFNYVPLPMDLEGIVTKRLIEHLKMKRKAFLMVDTYYNMPQGITYSNTRRMELAKLSAEWQLPIIETEFVKDCWHETPPEHSIKSMDRHQNVIYIFSLARPLMSILMQAIIAPKSIMPVLMDIKQQKDGFTDITSQLIS
jgi:GntR family transcriptional regulator of abcA and norABC